MRVTETGSRRLRGRRYLSLAVQLVVIFGGLLVLSEGLSRLTNEDEPGLFYRKLHGDPLDDYSGVITIAHNTGSRPAASRLANANNADMIEIDVRYEDGRLLADHTPAMGEVGRFLSRVPSLASVWPAASEGGAVNLDLKSTSPRALDKLFSFLENRKDDETVVVITSRSSSVLERVATDYPEAVRIFSIGSRAQLEAFQMNDDAQASAEGVSVVASALDEESVLWLKEREFRVFAWVVNDLPRTNDLVTWGVDGIVSDNLALIRLLGGDEDDAGTAAIEALRPLTAR